MFILGRYFEIINHALFRQVFTKTKLVKIIERKERQRKKAEGTPSSDDVQYKKHDLCSNMSEEIPICQICKNMTEKCTISEQTKLLKISETWQN